MDKKHAGRLANKVLLNKSYKQTLQFKISSFCINRVNLPPIADSSKEFSRQTEKTQKVEAIGGQKRSRSYHFGR